MTLHLTENARKELQRLCQSSPDPANTGLRLSVAKGGCAGMQYIMEITTAQADDLIIEDQLFLARDSQEYLEGCEIYYSYGLTDSGFKIRNPNATRSCGCGTSFETKETEGTYDPDQACK